MSGVAPHAGAWIETPHPPRSQALSGRSRISAKPGTAERPRGDHVLQPQTSRPALATLCQAADGKLWHPMEDCVHGVRHVPRHSVFHAAWRASGAGPTVKRLDLNAISMSISTRGFSSAGLRPRGARDAGRRGTVGIKDHLGGRIGVVAVEQAALQARAGHQPPFGTGRTLPRPANSRLRRGLRRGSTGRQRSACSAAGSRRAGPTRSAAVRR